MIVLGSRDSWAWMAWHCCVCHNLAKETRAELPNALKKMKKENDEKARKSVFNVLGFLQVLQTSLMFHRCAQETQHVPAALDKDDQAHPVEPTGISLGFYMF